MCLHLILRIFTWSCLTTKATLMCHFSLCLGGVFKPSMYIHYYSTSRMRFQSLAQLSVVFRSPHNFYNSKKGNGSGGHITCCKKLKWVHSRLMYSFWTSNGKRIFLENFTCLVCLDLYCKTYFGSNLHFILLMEYIDKVILERIGSSKLSFSFLKGRLGVMSYFLTF